MSRKQSDKTKARAKHIQETNLEEVKKLAIAFLYLDIVKTRFSPIVVQHPFFDSAFVGLIDNGELRAGNILESETDLALAREIKKHQINEAHSVVQLSTYITKPYKLAFLRYAEGYLSPADIGRYLAANWSSIEYINTDKDVSIYEIIRLLEISDKSTLMTEEERAAIESWPEEITVYRGVTDYNKKHVKGLSWTRSIKTAEFFATRFKGESQGTVYKATIRKEDILAYITGRSEEEVIVNINGLKDIMEI